MPSVDRDARAKVILSLKKTICLAELLDDAGQVRWETCFSFGCDPSVSISLGLFDLELVFRREVVIKFDERGCVLEGGDEDGVAGFESFWIWCLKRRLGVCLLLA